MYLPFIGNTSESSWTELLMKYMLNFVTGHCCPLPNLWVLCFCHCWNCWDLCWRVSDWLIVHFRLPRKSAFIATVLFWEIRKNHKWPNVASKEGEDPELLHWQSSVYWPIVLVNKPFLLLVPFPYMLLSLPLIMLVKYLTWGYNCLHSQKRSPTCSWCLTWHDI